MAVIVGQEIDRYLSLDQPLIAAVEFTLTTAGDTSAWTRFFGPVTIQVTGKATAVNVQPEVSQHDPTADQGPEISPMGAITGNPTSGIPPLYAMEAGAPWWRVRLVSITGTPVKAVIRGQRA